MKPGDAALIEGGATRVPVEGLRAGRRFAAEDWIADEVPVALEFNGISHAVMLATPCDLADFALGFALTEGIVERAAECRGIEHEASAEGITVKVEIAAAAFARLKARRRTLAGRTGCGLCGVESLEHVARPIASLLPGPAIATSALARAMTELRALQPLHGLTGATHAAGWCTAEGELRWLREDVGRHNALDKLVGALAANRVDAAEGFVVVTSRASYEMVQKTAAARVPLLAAVSAPTTLAVRSAEGCGLGLAGFVRDGGLTIYSHAERFAFEAADPRCTPTP